jgi:hypothetical protein
MYYEARYYDPLLARFAQADTIVPEAGSSQGLNRYSYVNNSPTGSIDPTGHCTLNASGHIAVGVDGKILESNCTVGMFHALDWLQRSEWLQLFTETNDLGKWFDDIYNTIGFFSSDTEFSDMAGWTAYADAAVLQAINDGWRSYRGDTPIGGDGTSGSSGWHRFFSMYSSYQQGNIDLDQLIAVRLEAEQQGVDYARSLPESRRRYNNSDLYTQIQIETFLQGANSYRAYAPKLRSLTSAPIIGSLVTQYTDPRTSWSALEFGSRILQPLSRLFYGNHQCMAVGPSCTLF